MNKNSFDEWNGIKKHTEEKDSGPFFYEREVWWCLLGKNIGFEQDGKNDFSRPVVVLKKFNLDICLVVPLTTANKSGKYYFEIGEIDNKLNKAVISQIRLIDKKRFVNRIDILNKDVFNNLLEKITEVNFKKSL
jgi:mRNA interferase MazF